MSEEFEEDTYPRNDANPYAEEEEVFGKALQDVIGWNAKRDSLNAQISKARKGWKAKGIALGKLDETIKKLAWTPQEYRSDIATQQRYDRYAGLAVGTQVDLLAHASDEDVAKADWRSRGTADALRLKPATPPKGCPPDMVQHYLEGHESAKWWPSEEASAPQPAEA